MMSEPVKTVYGNIMERSVIVEWMAKQGHICPLTGAPLSETDLTADTELKTKIRKWILQRSMRSADDVTEEEKASGKPSATKSKAPKEDNDDLYDF
jgi:hypothetical protein